MNEISIPTLISLFQRYKSEEDKAHPVHNNRSKHRRNNCSLKNCGFSKKMHQFSQRHRWYISFLAMMLCMDSISAKCYTTKPGITIFGAEYRKEYEIPYQQCARLCYTDISCMAFEWSKKENDCIFKSRSLNGTFSTNPDVYFGLCLDRGDPENMRDLFYDHEFGGIEFASSTQKISHEKCQKFCAKNAKSGKKFLKNLAYTWRPTDPKTPNTIDGNCSCVKSLHYVKLKFGSISAYLG